MSVRKLCKPCSAGSLARPALLLPRWEAEISRWAAGWKCCSRRNTNCRNVSPRRLLGSSSAALAVRRISSSCRTPPRLWSTSSIFTEVLGSFHILLAQCARNFAGLSDQRAPRSGRFFVDKNVGGAGSIWTPSDATFCGGPIQDHRPLLPVSPAGLHSSCHDGSVGVLIHDATRGVESLASLSDLCDWHARARRGSCSSIPVDVSFAWLQPIHDVQMRHRACA